MRKVNNIRKDICNHYLNMVAMNIVYPEYFCGSNLPPLPLKFALKFAVFFENLPKLPEKCFTLLRPQEFNYLERRL